MRALSLGLERGNIIAGKNKGKKVYQCSLVMSVYIQQNGQDITLWFTVKREF